MKLATGAVIGTVLSMFLGASAPAQAAAAAASGAEVPAETLTGGISPEGTRISGWFLAPTFGTTGFAGNLNYSPGLRGGIYLNKRFALGLTAQGLGSSSSTFQDKEVRNVGAYGGLLLQYVLQSDKLVHATFETTVGSGKWCVLATDQSDSCSGRDFMVLEPMANVEINVAKHVRLATGVGYRFAVAGSGEGPSSRDMSSLVARTSVIFGSF